MWGAMLFKGTGFLTEVVGNINGTGYINILSDSAVPSAHYLGYVSNFVLQDDAAPCHRARVANEWKEEQGIRTLVWPGAPVTGLEPH